MKGKRKLISRCFSVLLALALVLSDLPGMSMTAYAEDGIEYVDANGDVQTYTGSYTEINSSNKQTNLSDGWYYFIGKFTYNSNVNINGDVHLIVADGAGIGWSYGYSIVVNEGNSLTIYGQSGGTGKLAVEGGSTSVTTAGIGSSSGKNCGDITINGGVIKATGAGSGAAIGGGKGGNGGTITINGGTVTAYSGNGSGAAIGGGNGGNGGTITINGGTVTAYTSDQIRYPDSGAAIGGGNGGSGGNITINGGTVTAYHNTGWIKSAVIGGGNGGDGGNITITGGTVEATGQNGILSSYGGAGIGGGYNSNGGTIKITGGTVTAAGQMGGAGIGGGNGGSGGIITISGGTVTATGSFNRDAGGAGIGGGCNGAGGTITINGGNVTAKGNTGGAGIGGGYLASSGSITINGGTVDATNSQYGTNQHSKVIGAGANATKTDKTTINGGIIYLHSVVANGYGLGNASIKGGIIDASDKCEKLTDSIVYNSFSGGVIFGDFIDTSGKLSGVSATNGVVLGDTTIDFDYTLESGKTITVKNGATLTLTGSFTNNGTLTANAGNSIVLNGTFTNNGTVNFRGSVGNDAVVYNNSGAFFHCYGNHNGISNKITNNGIFLCEGSECSETVDGTNATVQTITWDLTNLAVTNESGRVFYTDEYSCTFGVTDEDYVLPGYVKVVMNGNPLTSGTHYSYDSKTGKFVLFKNVVIDKKVTITASAVERYELTQDDGNGRGLKAYLAETSFLYTGEQICPEFNEYSTFLYMGDGFGEYLTENEDYVITYVDNIEAGTGKVVITGMGRYRGSIELSFEIYKLDLEFRNDDYGACSNLQVEDVTYQYNGLEHTPSVTVTYCKPLYNYDSDFIGYDNAVTLTEGVDYEVTYENNIEPGTATVRITGIGKYTGTMEKTFTIGKGSISNCTPVSTSTMWKEGGITPDIVLTINGVVLTQGVDWEYADTYEISCFEETKEITIKGKGDRFNSNSTLTFTWSASAYDLSSYEVDRIVYNYDSTDEDFGLIYTGQAQTPEGYVVVKNSEGNELSIMGTWSSVTNVSDVTTFTPDSTYGGFTLTVENAISPKSIGSTFAGTSAYTYDGTQKSISYKPYISSSGETIWLTVDTDYEISGVTSATEPGGYAVTVTGKGNYTGTTTVTWYINPVTLTDSNVTIGEVTTHTYDGEAHTPDATVSYALANGETVAVSGTWSEVTNVSDKSTFTPNDDKFTGTVTLSGVITALDITDKVKFSGDSNYYTGYSQSIWAYIDGYQLTYKGSWNETPIKVGDYEYTITATGNFTGTVTQKFTVKPGVLTAKIKLKQKYYDGTTDVEIMNISIEGAANTDTITPVYDSLDDVVITLPSANAGTYATAPVSGISITGDNVDQYTFDDSTATLISQYSATGSFYISKSGFYIEAEDQEITGNELIDQMKWKTSGLNEKFTVGDVVLTVSGNKIVPSGGKVYLNDEDVTDNFTITYYSANLSRACEGHYFNAYGFCATGSCGTFESAVLNDNGTEETYDDYYEIYNAGQLYWYALRVNNYSENSVPAKLMNDIVVPKTVGQDSTSKIPDWTPIQYLYAEFDGQGHTISGLYCSLTDTNYVGFMGTTGYYSIHDLMLTDCYFEGNNYVGGIAGDAECEIYNCGVTDTVTVKCNNGTACGGIAGYAGSVGITNCYAVHDKLIGFYYTNDYYKPTVTNCYFLGTADDTNLAGCYAKSEAEFNSGEVAYLLQSGVTAVGSYDDDGNYSSYIPLVWGQNIDNGKKVDAYPNFSGAAVYKVNGTNCKDDAIVAYSNDEAAEITGRHILVDGVCSVCETDFNRTVALTSRVEGADTNETVGTLTGGGKYILGDEVTVTAPEKEGFTFKGWYSYTVDAEENITYDKEKPVSEELSYTFTITDNVSLVAVYVANGKISLTVHVTGNEYKVNENDPSYEEENDGTKWEFYAGTRLTVKYTGDEEFLYWKNASDKIVSKEAEYSFTLVSTTALTAVTVDESNSEDVDGSVVYSALVEFISSYGQVIESTTWKSTDVASDHTLPSGPSKPGGTFQYWSMDGTNKVEPADIVAAIAGGQTRITVTPVYEDVDETYTVKVIYKGDTSLNVTYSDKKSGSTLTVTAADIEGKTFAYWSSDEAGEKIVSYNESYFILISGDVTLYAHYEDEATGVDAEPLIVMTNTYTETTSGKNKIVYEITRSIPQEYELIEHGVIYTKEDTYKDNADNMLLDAKDVKHAVSSDKNQNGYLVIYMNMTGYEDNILYVKGYAVIRNQETGNTETIYTDMVAESFNSLSNSQKE